MKFCEQNSLFYAQLRYINCLINENQSISHKTGACGKLSDDTVLKKTEQIKPSKIVLPFQSRSRNEFNQLGVHNELKTRNILFIFT